MSAIINRFDHAARKYRWYHRELFVYFLPAANHTAAALRQEEGIWSLSHRTSAESGKNIFISTRALSLSLMIFRWSARWEKWVKYTNTNSIAGRKSCLKIARQNSYRPWVSFWIERKFISEWKIRSVQSWNAWKTQQWRKILFSSKFASFLQKKRDKKKDKENFSTKRCFQQRCDI